MADPGRRALRRRQAKELTGVVLASGGMVGAVVFAFILSTAGGWLMICLMLLAVGVVLGIDV